MAQYSSLFKSLGKKISEDTKSLFGKGKILLSQKTEKIKEKIEEKTASKRVSLYPENSAKALGPYSPAMDTGRFIFFSGQIALDAEGKFHDESLESESVQVFKNIDTLLKAAGCAKENIVKATVFLRDLKDFEAFNVLYSEYLEGHKPARSCVQVVLPKNARVEVEVLVQR